MSNSNKICFVSVVTPGADHRYVDQQIRLLASLANLGYDCKAWTEEYPPGARPHYESLYGFKVHAVKKAYDEGYRRIVWVDTACILQRPVPTSWFEANYPVLAARDDNKLARFLSPRLQRIYGDLKGAHLVGGSLYVFNFTHPKCQEIFNNWYSMEAQGWFGSSGQKLGPHRHDETMMALALEAAQVKPVSCEELGYNTGEDSVIAKKHFK
jgi:hypothetical protein